MARLTAEWREQVEEGRKLDAAIEGNLKGLGVVSGGGRSNTEIRQLMLQYFYDRNANATSARGKKGAAVKISDVKKELKAGYGLKPQQIVSNLTYLISQGWIEEESVEKVLYDKTRYKDAVHNHLLSHHRSRH